MPHGERPRCVVTGLATAEIDVAALWEAHRAGGPDRWPEVTKETTSYPVRVAEVAHRALRESAADPAGTAAVLGSLHGMGFVAESIRQRLTERGARWLDPEAFLCFTPHGLTAAVCLRLGLQRFAATLLGPAAGLQALAQASRKIRLGAERTVLCGAYEVLSPAASARVDGGGTNGSAVFLVVESEAEAFRRGARVLASLGPVRSCPEHTWLPDAQVLPVDAGAVAPLAGLVEALRGSPADRSEVAVQASAPGVRYRCELELGGTA